MARLFLLLGWLISHSVQIGVVLAERGLVAAAEVSLGIIVKTKSFSVFVGHLEICLIITAFARLCVVDAMVRCAWGA